MATVGWFQQLQLFFVFLLILKPAASSPVYLADDEDGGICRLLPADLLDSLLTTCPRDPTLYGQHLRVLAIEVRKPKNKIVTH